MNEINRVIEIVREYFKDVPDKDFMECVDALCIDSDDQDTTRLIQFMKDIELYPQYEDYLYDQEHPNQMFRRSKMSGSQMINNLNTAFLFISHMKHSTKVDMTDADSALNKAIAKVVKTTNNLNRVNFEYLKDKAIMCYESLCRAETYLVSEEIDKTTFDTIKKLNYETV